MLLPVSVRYRLLDPTQYAPPEDHQSLGEDVYIAPDEDGLDALETQGIVDVIDWNYDADGEAGETLAGPPEPVVREDGTVAIVRPDEDGTTVDAYELGEWVCQRCGTTTKQPVVNGEVEPPHECANCERQGPFEQRGLADRPDISASTYADPQWYTPAGVDGERYGELWDDIRDWLYTNWVTDEEHYYEGLTAFAISTWLRPNLNFLPQLMVMGKHETGKTQLLTTLARVGYRNRVPVSFTPAAIFRTIDRYDITLFLSEYHDLNPDLRDEINAVIKGSQKRGEGGAVRGSLLRVDYQGFLQRRRELRSVRRRLLKNPGGLPDARRRDRERTQQHQHQLARATGARQAVDERQLQPAVLPQRQRQRWR